jgi:putative CRISPR-associated protein (TIGR02619 family)
MTTQVLLLSTCGTSVLTNRATPETRSWLIKIANEATLKADTGRLDAHVAACKERLLNAGKEEARDLSAEVNGIAAVLERWPASRVQHVLVHTDTATGKAAAEVVAAFLENQGGYVQLLTAPGLRTDDFPSFRKALADLTVDIENWTQDRSSIKLFNLTGGFKSVGAYLQALGMLYADRCVFLFEGASALMEIPRLPVRIADADEVRAHLHVFRRLACGYAVAEKDGAGVPDSLVLADNGEAKISVWGDVVWGKVRHTLLSEKLLPPLSPKLDVKDAVLRAFDGLQEKGRRVLVNEALDALSAHLDLGSEPQKSHTFKKLKGNPTPPSTHELYVWSDRDAWRLCGHFEGGRFIADSLGPHL